MTTENPEHNIPEEWLIEAESIFNKVKSNATYISRNEFHQFFLEFLKNCPQEMSKSQPPLEDFFERFSSNKNDSFTLNDFKRVFTELCLVRIDYIIDGTN
jgi:hypothetical protein